MKRTTIFLDEQVEGDLYAFARRQGRPVAALVREALAQYLGEQKRQLAPTIGFLGAGRSGHRDTANRHEQLLWQDRQPHAPEPAPPRASRQRSGSAPRSGRPPRRKRAQ